MFIMFILYIYNLIYNINIFIYVCIHILHIYNIILHLFYYYIDIYITYYYIYIYYTMIPKFIYPYLSFGNPQRSWKVSNWMLL